MPELGCCVHGRHSKGDRLRNYDMSTPSHACLAVSPTRRIEEFLIANRPLAAHQRDVPGAADLSIDPAAWLATKDVADFLISEKSTLLDADGNVLAWSGDAPDSDSGFVGKDSFVIRFPWDFIRANEQYVGKLRDNLIEGNVHPSAVVEGVVQIGSGTRILPGVFIEGNVVIGSNCKIGPNCYIRGNTSIGDQCHIGQSVEIKNCLILSRSNVGHLSYVGDSVLGENVNFGAGTTTSNLRHDGKNHRSFVAGELIDTGRRKFGTIVGDGVHTGIHTSIYPGRKLGPGSSTRPGEIVRNDLESTL